MYEKEIAAGIKLLDEKGPEDWRSRIDLDDLHMELGSYCILGWIYNHFTDGLDALKITDLGASRFGFTLPGRDYVSAYPSIHQWMQLRDEWLEVLNQDRKAVEV